MRRLVETVRARPDDTAAITLLALVPLLTLGRALLPGRVLSPGDAVAAVLADGRATGAANPLLWDVAFMFHPWLLYAAAEIRDGRFPLWNPHAFTGAPFFANPQTALLYPPHALAWVLPMATALALIAMVKLVSAGLGTYWFLRLLGVTPAPACLGALAFELSGILVVWLQWSFGSAIALLPLLFALTEWLRARCTPRRLAALAAGFATLALAGYPQAVVTGGLAAAAWALVRARQAAAPVPFLLAWAGAGALGAGLAAVQLLPFLEYARESAVLAYRREFLWVMALPPRAAIAFVMPYYYGSPTGGDFWGPANFNELTTSVGLVPVAALPLALWGAWSRPATRFFAVLGGGALLMLYGLAHVVPGLATLPPFSMAINTRLSVFVALALVILAAIGLDAAPRASPAVRRRVARAVRIWFALVVVAAFLVLLDDHAFTARLPMRVPPPAQFLAALAALAATSLLLLRLLAGPAARWPWGALMMIQLATAVPLAIAYNPVIDGTRFYPPAPGVVGDLQGRQAADDRILFTARQAANLGTVFRLREAGGYDGMTPRRVEQVVDPEGSLDSLASGALRVTVPYGSPVFDLLGIRHVVAAPNGTTPPLPLEREAGDLRLYRNADALPRAFLVFQARGCVDDDEALRLMHAGSVDFGREVLIADCGPLPPVGPASAAPRASITRDDPEHVTVMTETGSPAFLVLTDTWFPGWRVRVDGEPAHPWRANHAFRAVWVPAGRHRAEFTYAPASLRYGLAVSLLSALIVLGMAARRGPRPGPAR